MKKYPDSVRAFTLMELLVVLAIIAVLAGMLVPAASRITQSRTTKCASYLRQLGIAAITYASDHDMTLPVTSHQKKQGGKSWSLTLQEYASGKVTFRCPCDENLSRTYTYVINDFLTPNPAGAPDLDYSKLSKLERPSQTILFAEALQTYTNSDHFHFSDYKGFTIPPDVFADQVAVQRHGGFANYLFADAHMETLSWEQAQARISAPGSRFVDPTSEEQPQ